MRRCEDQRAKSRCHGVGSDRSETVLGSMKMLSEGRYSSRSACSPRGDGLGRRLLLHSQQDAGDEEGGWSGMADSIRTPHWLLAGAARIVLILYGLWQDETMAVKYTDADYQVFSDAARMMATG
eukprot:710667-Hanusia_phi.AAC.1